MNIRDLQEKKKKAIPIVSLTAYDSIMASIFDESGIDLLLVGDSLGMVIYGYDSTVPVTVEMIRTHTEAVARVVKKSLVIADMPFGSYHKSLQDSIKNATILLRAGAQGVKVEGASSYVVRTIKRMIEAGIMVAGHIGFTPQQINRVGGNVIQGKSEEEAKKLMNDAKKLEKAGVSLLFLEMVPEKLAKNITENLKIPTIGIGAGKYCDGQVIVAHDMLGLFTKFKPKFVKRYANLAEDIKSAVLSYKEDVVKKRFPSDENTF
jgi:3-methyl-2-oxobutanoate hydroxymethyltransferase